MSITGPFIDELSLRNQISLSPIPEASEVLERVNDDLLNIRRPQGGRRATDFLPFGIRSGERSDTQNLLSANINDVLLREQQNTRDRIENALNETANQNDQFSESQIASTIAVVDSFLAATSDANGNPTTQNVSNDVINSFLVQALSILVQTDVPRDRDVNPRALQQTGPRQGDGINTNVGQRRFTEPFVPDQLDVEA